MPGQEILEVKHKDGTTAFKCRENEGIKVPPRMQDPEKRIQELRELKYKEGDIFIASYPKVGKPYVPKDCLIYNHICICIWYNFTESNGTNVPGKSIRKLL